MAIQLRLRFSQSMKPYELQKLIPNHQSSICWIYLLLLTLSIIRSSCPELLVSPATLTLQHDLTIQLGSSKITTSSSVRNLGIIFDDQWTFKDHIAKTARSCRYALHNIRKIRPFLTEHAAQLLVQALVISRLDYCNAQIQNIDACI